MELRDTADEAAFRQEVRGFIAANLPEPSAKRGARRFEDADREWSKKLGEAGYAGLTWPTATRRSSSRSLRAQRRRRTSA